MKYLRKNKLAVFVILVAGILILMVNSIYEERIRQIQEKLPDLYDTSVKKTD